MRDIIEYIACIDACDIPEELDDYCDKNDIYLHYEQNIYAIHDDGNVFAEWLKTNGYKFKTNCDYIGIIGT